MRTHQGAIAASTSATIQTGAESVIARAAYYFVLP